MADLLEQVRAIATECQTIAEQANTPPLGEMIKRLEEAVARAGRSHSRSWLGYHSRLYYRGFEEPPSDDWLDSAFGRGSDSWREFDSDDIDGFVMRAAGNPDKSILERSSHTAAKRFHENHDALLAINAVLLDQSKSSMLEEIRDDLRKLKLFTVNAIIGAAAPSQIASADSAAWAEGRTTPPHVALSAWLASHRLVFAQAEKLGALAQRTLAYLERAGHTRRSSAERIFIAHGRSPVWRDLRDFLDRRLRLETEEFNSEPVAGITIPDRINQMLDRCTFAFIVMTGEDEHADASLHARENVIHETGRAQQKFSSKRTIVLLEDGCAKFSNLQGIIYIRFPKGDIRPAFEEIREVLERERILPAP